MREINFEQNPLQHSLLGDSTAKGVGRKRKKLRKGENGQLILKIPIDENRSKQVSKTLAPAQLAFSGKYYQGMDYPR